MKDKTKWMSRVYLILVIFTFGIVWQICSDKGIVNELFFSSPKKVIADFIDMFVTGYIFPHIKITLYATFVGLAYGIVLGSLTAFLVGNNKVLEPLGEAKADVFILQGIAENMGFGDVYPKTKEELLLWMCKGDKELLENLIRNEYGVFEEKKITYYKYKTGKIRADRQPGFPTPSGKFEICSAYIQQYGYTPYPEYKDIRSIENLGSKEDYPLIMTTAARSGLRFCSFGPGIKKIAMKERVPTIDIGEKDAKKYGLKNGEEAIVETVFGKEEFKVRICPMAEGSIHVAGGTGSCYMEGEWRNHNINNVCSMNYSDPISGFLILKSIPCRVLAKTIYNNKNGEKHSPLF